MKYPQQTYIALLNLLLGAYFLMECIDHLKGTTAYKQRLKAILNQLEPEIHKLIDKDLSLLWGTDDAAMYNLMDGLKGFIQSATTLRPENISAAGLIIAQLKADPESVLEKLGIHIKEAA